METYNHNHIFAVNIFLNLPACQLLDLEEFGPCGTIDNQEDTECCFLDVYCLVYQLKYILKYTFVSVRLSSTS